MESGEIESNLVRLNSIYKLPWIPDLIDRKTNGKEKEVLDSADLAFHETEYLRLRSKLADAQVITQLPDHPDAADALDDLLLRLRTRG